MGLLNGSSKNALELIFIRQSQVSMQLSEMYM